MHESASEQQRYRQDSERVEHLLEEIRTTAGPATWKRVEELVQRLVGIYGAGLSRVLNHVSSAGAINEVVTTKLVDDELVASLLLLHGLHPVPMQERVRRALDQVRPYLGSHAGDVEVLEVRDDGVVRLRLLGSCQGCPSSRATVEQTLRRAIEEAAPEVTSIEVDGVPARGAPRPPPQWRLLHSSELPADGERRVVEVEGTSVLILNVGGARLAYRNVCASCSARLDGGALDDAGLCCPSCGARFDIARAGRLATGEGAPLVPIPLLPSGKTMRIAVSGGAV